MATKFQDMTQDERVKAFEKWQAGKEAKKGTNTAKRTAVAALIKAHQGEYDNLLKAAKGEKSAVKGK